MIGLDSNVLVRLAVQDDEEQYERARAFLSREVSNARPAYVNLIVLVEFAWTLRRFYRYSDTDVLAAVSKLLNAENVIIDRRSVVELSVRHCELNGGDYADVLIGSINREDGCATTVTFDRQFARSGLARLID
jgi:predicted nucleic-acid-binding protein